MNEIRLVLINSDLHSGSTVAAMPPSMPSAIDDLVYKANRVQRWYHEAFKEMEEWAFEIKGDDEMAYVINGDTIEGNHHRTYEIVSPDVLTHQHIAAHMVNNLNGASAKTFLTVGTEVHTGNSEIALGDLLGAEKCPVTGKAASNQWRLKFNGVLCSFAHHCSATSRPYLESGELGRMLGTEIQESARAGYEPPRIVVRAHRHKHGEFCDGHGMAFTTGAWQGLTRHGNKVVPAAVPAPSAIMLDWRGKEHGALPTVHRFFKTLPERKAVTL